MDGYQIGALSAAGLFCLVLFPRQLLLVKRRTGASAVVALRSRDRRAALDAAAAAVLWVDVLGYVVIWTLWPQGYAALAPLPLAAWLRPVGAAVGTAGLALFAAAYWTMGESVRIGIDRSAPGPLVTRGVFRYLRHPVYLGLMLALGGLFLMAPSLFSLALWLASSAAMILQARREESALIERHGSEYLDYAARTGRFFPRLRCAG